MTMIANHQALVAKYNVPVPRYTSYPTVPYWNTSPPSREEWGRGVRAKFAENNELSLYIHLPFCEQLCTYCGCNTRITKRHSVELPYIEAVLKEWAMYQKLLGEKPIIRELHLGGGTPTFFSPENLRVLIEGILADTIISENQEFSFEAHPSTTSYQHLQVLFELGFERISVGVQDFSQEILKVINRHQTEKQVRDVTAWAREIGYTSINYDIIFGLPLQTSEHIIATMERLKELQPDRLAFYSYAHVPWVKPGQRAYGDKDLPNDAEKRALYELGRTLLEEMGYVEIGMDHFALPSDSLYQAMEKGEVHRNFMGYTTANTDLLIGLGVSAISDSWTGFVQNEKKLEQYIEVVNEGIFPFFRGHILNEEDLVIRQHIGSLMCLLKTRWSLEEVQHPALVEGLKRLEEMIADDLLEMGADYLQVTEKGRPFLRNICAALDARLWRNKPSTQLFSQSI